MLQHGDCLAASAAGIAVYKQRDILIVGYRTDFVNGLQRYIFTSGNMTFPILLGRAYIQKDRSIGITILHDTLIDVRLFQKVEESHIHASLFFFMALL